MLELPNRRLLGRVRSAGRHPARPAVKLRQTNIHRLSVDEAFATLRSSPAGLSSAEAARRLREFGPNGIHKEAREPAPLRLLREFFRFFSVILWVAAAARSAPSSR